MSNNPSIINIIQEMISRGSNEEEIMKTLKELGVAEDQIKNLMLVAQGSTFTLLKSEISKITNEAIENSLPKYEEKLYQKISADNSTQLKELEDKIKANLKLSQDSFEQKQIKDLRTIESIAAQTKELEERQSQDISMLDNKIDAKLIGSTRGLFILRVLAFILGFALLLLCAYKFFTLGSSVSLDFIVIYASTIIAAAAIMSVSLL